MAELVRPWNDGGSLSAAYNGSGDGEAIFSSDANEGLDREISVAFISKSSNISVNRVVRQSGRREIFNEDFILADGGTFNVLKNGLQ